MTRIGVLAAIGSVALGLALTSQADAYSVGGRSYHMQQRLNAGASAGRLTAGEQGRLQTRESIINHTAASDRAANGGTLTRGEKVRLGARQEALSGSIDAQAHDAQTAPPK